MCSCSFHTWLVRYSSLPAKQNAVHMLQAKHVTPQVSCENYVCLWVGCKVYARTSCSRSWLERHVLSHGGNKPFRCIVDGCGQRFSSQVCTFSVYIFYSKNWLEFIVAGFVNSFCTEILKQEWDLSLLKWELWKMKCKDVNSAWRSCICSRLYVLAIDLSPHTLLSTFFFFRQLQTILIRFSTVNIVILRGLAVAQAFITVSVSQYSVPILTLSLWHLWWHMVTFFPSTLVSPSLVL